MVSSKQKLISSTPLVALWFCLTQFSKKVIICVFSDNVLVKMNISRKATIKKLQQMAQESPFTVVKCGEALQQLVVSNEEEEETFPCQRSGCKTTFRDNRSGKEYLKEKHS